VVLGTTELILPEDLPETVLDTKTPARAAASGYHEAVAQTKREIILEAMEQAKGNITEAGRILRIHPNYLHRLIRNLNLRDDLKQQN